MWKDCHFYYRHCILSKATKFYTWLSHLFKGYSHYISLTESYIYRIMGNVQHNGYV